MSEKVYRAVKDGEPVEVELEEFVCHKHVRAAKIVAITQGSEPRTQRLALAGGCHVEVSHLWVSMKAPQVGGYFVQYDDGYSSYSPAEAFENGYLPLKAQFLKDPAPSESVELAMAKAQIEQLQTQLAACLSAADGATGDPAAKDSFGWSPAYQAVLELRREHEALTAALEDKGLPSGADMDAAAQEQAVADATSNAQPAIDAADPNLESRN